MFAFAERRNGWVKSPAHRGKPLNLRQFSVATFNVWYDAFEAERRRRAVLSILADALPDVIALEEVTPDFLAQLLATPWVREHYRSSRASLDPGQSYDVVMLSRHPVLRFVAHTLPTTMGRRLHTLVLHTRFGELAIAGVHMESMRDRTAMRLAQIEEAARVLSRSAAAIWLGDFNAGPGSEEDEQMRRAFRDAWDELSDAPGYTRDTTRNAMLAKVKADRHQRIDRVLLRGDALGALRIRLLGTEPLPDSAGQIFPSDHFGLLAEVVDTQLATQAKISAQ